MTRLPFIHMALAACLAAVGFASHAQEWPSKKVIALVVPYAAGGSTDATARLIADKLGKELGQQVVVDNRPGAGSNLGAAFVAKAPPDGYTLLLGTSAAATNVTLYKNPGFDLRKDLVPVAQVAQIPTVLAVNNDVPAKTLQEFIAYAQQKSVPVSYGSAGNGTSSHLSGALFNSMVKGNMLHVPYKGGAPANTDLMGGQVQAVFSPLVEVLAYIDSGLTPLPRTGIGLRLKPDLGARSAQVQGCPPAAWRQPRRRRRWSTRVRRSALGWLLRPDAWLRSSPVTGSPAPSGGGAGCTSPRCT